MGDPTARLLPDFRRRAVIVRLPVGRVGVLVRVEIPLRVLGEDAPRLADGAIGTLQRARQHQRRAVRLQDPLSLLVGILGQAEFHGIAPSGADHRVGDPGIPGGGIQDRLVAGQAPGVLAVQDHVERGAVLDRAGRVVPLRLGQHAQRQDVLSHTPERQQRRVADQVQQRARCHRRNCPPQGVHDHFLVILEESR